MTNTPMPPSRITIQHPTRRAWCRASRASSDQQADCAIVARLLSWAFEGLFSAAGKAANF